MTQVTLRQDAPLVRIADLCLFVDRDDWTYSALLADPRAFEIDASSTDLTWSARDMAPEPDWVAGKKGLPFTAWAALHCRRNGLSFTVLDIGANIGLEGIAQAILHKRCGWDAPVVLFEPGPTFDLVDRSLRRNAVADVARVVRSAVSDKAGEATFFVFPDASGGSSLLEEKARSAGAPASVETITVDMIAIDDFVTENGIVSDALVVKIDTEGNDFKVIAGMKNVLATRLVFMQIEFIPNIIESYCAPERVLSDLLETHVLVDSASKALITAERIAPFTLASRNLAHPPDLLAIPRRAPRAMDLLEAVLAG